MTEAQGATLLAYMADQALFIQAVFDLGSFLVGVGLSIVFAVAWGRR